MSILNNTNDLLVNAINGQAKKPVRGNALRKLLSRSLPFAALAVGLLTGTASKVWGLEVGNGTTSVSVGSDGVITNKVTVPGANNAAPTVTAIAAGDDLTNSGDFTLNTPGLEAKSYTGSNSNSIKVFARAGADGKLESGTGSLNLTGAANLTGTSIVIDAKQLGASGGSFNLIVGQSDFSGFNQNGFVGINVIDKDGNFGTINVSAKIVDKKYLKITLGGTGTKTTITGDTHAGNDFNGFAALTGGGKLLVTGDNVVLGGQANNLVGGFLGAIDVFPTAKLTVNTSGAEGTAVAPITLAYGSTLAAGNNDVTISKGIVGGTVGDSSQWATLDGTSRLILKGAVGAAATTTFNTMGEVRFNGAAAPAATLNVQAGSTVSFGIAAVTTPLILNAGAVVTGDNKNGVQNTLTGAITLLSGNSTINGGTPDSKFGVSNGLTVKSPKITGTGGLTISGFVSFAPVSVPTGLTVIINKEGRLQYTGAAVALAGVSVTNSGILDLTQMAPTAATGLGAVQVFGYTGNPGSVIIVGGTKVLAAAPKLAAATKLTGTYIGEAKDSVRHLMQTLLVTGGYNFTETTFKIAPVTGGFAAGENILVAILGPNSFAAGTATNASASTQIKGAQALVNSGTMTGVTFSHVYKKAEGDNVGSIILTASAASPKPATGAPGIVASASADGIEGLSAFDATKAYAINDVVTVGINIFKAKVAIATPAAGSPTATPQANATWDPVTPTTASLTSGLTKDNYYSVGGLIYQATSTSTVKLVSKFDNTKVTVVNSDTAALWAANAPIQLANGSVLSGQHYNVGASAANQTLATNPISFAGDSTSAVIRGGAFGLTIGNTLTGKEDAGAVSGNTLVIDQGKVTFSALAKIATLQNLIVNNATLTLSNAAAGGTTGVKNLTIGSGATVIHTVANQQSGANSKVNLAGGTWVNNAAVAYRPAAGTVSASGGTDVAVNLVDGTSSVIITGLPTTKLPTTVVVMTLKNAVTGSGSVKVGDGTQLTQVNLLAANNTGTWHVSKDSAIGGLQATSFSGSNDVTLDGGNLNFAAKTTSAAPFTTKLTLTSGSVSTIKGSGAANAVGANPAATEAAKGRVDLSGIISGDGSLTITNGDFYLTGVNTFKGALKVAGAVAGSTNLYINSATAYNNAISLDAGASLGTAGTGNLTIGSTGSLTLAGAATLDASSSTGTGITIEGVLTGKAAVILTVKGKVALNNAQNALLSNIAVVNGGTLTLGNSYALGGTSTATIALTAGDAIAAAIPGAAATAAVKKAFDDAIAGNPAAKTTLKDGLPTGQLVINRAVTGTTQTVVAASLTTAQKLNGLANYSGTIVLNGNESLATDAASGNDGFLGFTNNGMKLTSTYTQFGTGTTRIEGAVSIVGKATFVNLALGDTARAFLELSTASVATSFKAPVAGSAIVVTPTAANTVVLQSFSSAGVVTNPTLIFKPVGGLVASAPILTITAPATAYDAVGLDGDIAAATAAKVVTAAGVTTANGLTVGANLTTVQKAARVLAATAIDTAAAGNIATANAAKTAALATVASPRTDLSNLSFQIKPIPGGLTVANGLGIQLLKWTGPRGGLINLPSKWVDKDAVRIASLTGATPAAIAAAAAYGESGLILANNVFFQDFITRYGGAAGVASTTMSAPDRKGSGLALTAQVTFKTKQFFSAKAAGDLVTAKVGDLTELNVNLVFSFTGSKASNGSAAGSSVLLLNGSTGTLDAPAAPAIGLGDNNTWYVTHKGSDVNIRAASGATPDATKGQLAYVATPVANEPTTIQTASTVTVGTANGINIAGSGTIDANGNALTINATITGDSLSGLVLTDSGTTASMVAKFLAANPNGQDEAAKLLYTNRGSFTFGSSALAGATPTFAGSLTNNAVLNVTTEIKVGNVGSGSGTFNFSGATHKLTITGSNDDKVGGGSFKNTTIRWTPSSTATEATEALSGYNVATSGTAFVENDVAPRLEVSNFTGTQNYLTDRFVSVGYTDSNKALTITNKATNSIVKGTAASADTDVSAGVLDLSGLQGANDSFVTGIANKANLLLVTKLIEGAGATDAEKDAAAITANRLTIVKAPVARATGGATQTDPTKFDVSNLTIRITNIDKLFLSGDATTRADFRGVRPTDHTPKVSGKQAIVLAEIVNTDGASPTAAIPNTAAPPAASNAVPSNADLFAYFTTTNGAVIKSNAKSMNNNKYVVMLNKSANAINYDQIVLRALLGDTNLGTAAADQQNKVPVAGSGWVSLTAGTIGITDLVNTVIKDGSKDWASVGTTTTVLKDGVIDVTKHSNVTINSSATVIPVTKAGDRSKDKLGLDGVSTATVLKYASINTLDLQGYVTLAGATPFEINSDVTAGGPQIFVTGTVNLSGKVDTGNTLVSFIPRYSAGTVATLATFAGTGILNLGNHGVLGAATTLALAPAANSVKIGKLDTTQGGTLNVGFAGTLTTFVTRLFTNAEILGTGGAGAKVGIVAAPAKLLINVHGGSTLKINNGVGVTGSFGTITLMPKSTEIKAVAAGAAVAGYPKLDASFAAVTVSSAGAVSIENLNLGTAATDSGNTVTFDGTGAVTIGTSTPSATAGAAPTLGGAVSNFGTINFGSTGGLTVNATITNSGTIFLNGTGTNQINVLHSNLAGANVWIGRANGQLLNAGAATPITVSIDTLKVTLGTVNIGRDYVAGTPGTPGSAPGATPVVVAVPAVPEIAALAATVNVKRGTGAAGQKIVIAGNSTLNINNTNPSNALAAALTDTYSSVQINAGSFLNVLSENGATNFTTGPVAVAASAGKAAVPAVLAITNNGTVVLGKSDSTKVGKIVIPDVNNNSAFTVENTVAASGGTAATAAQGSFVTVTTFNNNANGTLTLKGRMVATTFNNLGNATVTGAMTGTTLTNRASGTKSFTFDGGTNTSAIATINNGVAAVTTGTAAPAVEGKMIINSNITGALKNNAGTVEFGKADGLSSAKITVTGAVTNDANMIVHNAAATAGGAKASAAGAFVTVTGAFTMGKDAQLDLRGNMAVGGAFTSSTGTLIFNPTFGNLAPAPTAPATTPLQGSGTGTLAIANADIPTAGNGETNASKYALGATPFLNITGAANITGMKIKVRAITGHSAATATLANDTLEFIAVRSVAGFTVATGNAATGIAAADLSGATMAGATFATVLKADNGAAISATNKAKNLIVQIKYAAAGTIVTTTAAAGANEFDIGKAPAAGARLNLAIDNGAVDGNNGLNLSSLSGNSQNFVALAEQLTNSAGSDLAKVMATHGANTTAMNMVMINADQAGFNTLIHQFSGSQNIANFTAAANISDLVNDGMNRRLSAIQSGGDEGVMGTPSFNLASGTSKVSDLYGDLSSLGLASSSVDNANLGPWVRVARSGSTLANTAVNNFSGGQDSFQAGFDTKVNKNFTLGFSTAYSDATSAAKGLTPTSASFRNLSVGTYGAWTTGRLGVDMQAGMNRGTAKTSRYVSNGLSDNSFFSADARDNNLSGNATGSYGFVGVNTAARVGYEVGQKSILSLRPYVGMDYSRTVTDSYQEEGQARWANLQVPSMSSEKAHATIGFDARKSFKTDEGTVTPRVSLGWKHLVTSAETSETFALVEDQSVKFNTKGNRYDRDAALVGAGIDVRMNNGFAMYGDYNNTISATTGHQNQSFILGGKFGF